LFDQITLKFNSSEPIVLTAQGVTVFVGPNNSGKSLVLKEIETAVVSRSTPTKILDGFTINWPSAAQLESIFEKWERFRPAAMAIGHVLVGRMEPGGGFNHAELDRDSVLRIAAEQSNKGWFATNVVRWGLIRLDGRSRFDLTNDQSGGDLLSRPANVLSHLFVDEDARKAVRQMVRDAFGLHFSLDPMNLGQLRIRLSQKKPLSDEQSLNESARTYFREAMHIKDASDGVQAYTGIAAAVLSGEYHSILIDEPEAFLHPPLARKLGKHLASLISKRGGALMASTHSADFLMGCVQAVPSVQVVRLEYQNGKSKGRLVDSAKLNQLFRNPLMRSANVISALFHDGVVVTESDNDRAVYAEIYHRLAEGNDNYPSILFVNAQNKQTIRDIIGPLREFGIPAAAIPDIDIVKDGGTTWTNWLSAAHVPSLMHLPLGQQRAALKGALEATGKDMNRDGGIAILGASDQAAAENFFDTLDEHGVFAVRRGELENWLPSLGVANRLGRGRLAGARR
jgi:energy-coupling factor transporter ATP-binding protein EcfA2